MYRGWYVRVTELHMNFVFLGYLPAEAISSLHNAQLFELRRMQTGSGCPESGLSNNVTLVWWTLYNAKESLCRTIQHPAFPRPGSACTLNCYKFAGDCQVPTNTCRAGTIKAGIMSWASNAKLSQLAQASALNVSYSGQSRTG